MTYSNGQYNPNPLANPFNTRLGPANYSLNPAGQSYKRSVFKSDRNAQLPDSIPLNVIRSSDLHVPDTAPPITLGQFQTILDNYSSNKNWNTNDIYKQDISYNSMSKTDIEYWDQINQQSAEISNKTSPEWIHTLQQFEQHFPSKFIDESTHKNV